MSDASQMEEKKFLVRVPKETHYQLKICAAEQAKPMAEIVRDAIEVYLKDYKKKRPA